MSGEAGEGLPKMHLKRIKRPESGGGVNKCHEFSSGCLMFDHV